MGESETAAKAEPTVTPTSSSEMSATVSSSTDTVDSSKTPSGNTRPNRTAGAGRSQTNPRPNSDGLVVVASSLSTNSQAAKNEAFSNVSHTSLFFWFSSSVLPFFCFCCLDFLEFSFLLFLSSTRSQQLFSFSKLQWSGSSKEAKSGFLWGKGACQHIHIRTWAHSLHSTTTTNLSSIGAAAGVFVSSTISESKGRKGVGKAVELKRCSVRIFSLPSSHFIFYKEKKLCFFSLMLMPVAWCLQAAPLDPFWMKKYI